MLNARVGTALEGGRSGGGGAWYEMVNDEA